MKFEKKQFIANLEKGMTVSDIFVVKNKSEIYRYSAGYRFELLLGDKTGEIYLKYWGTNDYDAVKKIWEDIPLNSVIYVEAKVVVWNNTLELSANEQSTIRVLGEEDYFKKDFIEISETIEKDMEELKSVIMNIDNDILRNFILNVFKNPNFLVEFKRSPASYLTHYFYAGGLVKHTLNVAKICLNISKIHEYFDKNLLLAGAILHDIGRTKQFKIDTIIKPTNSYFLEPHEGIGVRMLQPYYESMAISSDFQVKLNHLILTHHTQPALPEGYLLKYANDLDIKMATIYKLKQLKKDNIVEFEEGFLFF
ncbi:MAG: HDIG domain-containing protein [Candidatus Woesearchaeota archaeon]